MLGAGMQRVSITAPLTLPMPDGLRRRTSSRGYAVAAGEEVERVHGAMGYRDRDHRHMPLTLRLPLGVQARRLTAVKTVVVAAGMRNWILVELDTAEGTVGWREASLGWKTRAVVGSLDVLAAFVMGL